MRIIYFGTPEFAVKTFETLVNSDHEVVAVVTQPDKPVGRKGIVTPPPVKVAAEKFGIPVYQFAKIRENGAEPLKKLNADIMITCAYGQIISQEIIDICKYGIMNVHASLLPKYRGAAPIQYAIINGEKKTGITFMRTDAGLDTGDIIEKFETDIKDGETYGELSDRLSALASENILSVLSDIESGKAVYTKQDDSLATIVKPLKKEEVIVDFTKNSESVANLVNGVNPVPVARTFLRGKMIKIYKARVFGGLSDAKTENRKVGEVLAVGKRLLVKCGVGVLEITELQEEGGKRMSAEAFSAGRKVTAGDVFGNY